MQPLGTQTTRLPGLLGSLLATAGMSERHGRALDGAGRGHRCMRAPASGLAATRVSLPCALPSVAPLSSAPRVPTPAPLARPPCSQVRDARRTEEEEKVKLGFFLNNGALVLFLRTSDWHQRFRSSW